jgi:hypothetical protein
MLEEYPRDEGGEDHCDGCHPGVESQCSLPLDGRLMGTRASGARDCALTPLLRTSVIHTV